MFLNDVGIYLKDGPFSSDIGIVHLHFSNGTHWVVYTSEIYVDTFGFSPPSQKLSEFIIKANGHCLNSEYKIQVKEIIFVQSIVYIYFTWQKS